MKRRSFLKAVGGVAGTYYLGQNIALGAETSSKEKTAEMPKRTLGKTSQKVSIIGFPGLSLAKQGQD